MDNQDNPLSKEQLESRNDTLARAVAYEEIIHSKAWEFLKADIASEIQRFTTDALNGTITTPEQLAERRGEVNGLRNLLRRVDNTLRVLNDERTNQPTKTE